MLFFRQRPGDAPCNVAVGGLLNQPVVPSRQLTAFYRTRCSGVALCRRCLSGRRNVCAAVCAGVLCGVRTRILHTAADIVKRALHNVEQFFRKCHYFFSSIFSISFFSLAFSCSSSEKPLSSVSTSRKRYSLTFRLSSSLRLGSYLGSITADHRPF